MDSFNNPYNQGNPNNFPDTNSQGFDSYGNPLNNTADNFNGYTGDGNSQNINQNGYNQYPNDFGYNVNGFNGQNPNNYNPNPNGYIPNDFNGQNGFYLNSNPNNGYPNGYNQYISTDIPNKKKQKKQKKQKKRSGCLFALIKFLLFVVVVIALIVGIISYFGNKKEQEELLKIEKDILVEDVSEKINEELEILKTKESDIVGMTQYDKIMQGLSPYNNADSDADGLTDKEEIEIYHSDPLNPSSSGDGIPDSYKAKNNLSLTEKYDIKSVNYQGYSTYSNIDIKDKTSENSIVSITEIENYQVQGIAADKVYAIIDYNGKIELDFSDYISNSDYMIFKKNYTKDAEYEILKDKNGVVTVDTQGVDCVVGIVKLNIDALSSLEGEEIKVGNMGDSIVILMPITMLTGQVEVFVFEENFLGLNEEDRTPALNELFTNAWIKEDSGYTINVTHKYLGSIEFQMLSKVLNFATNGTMYKEVMEKQGVETTQEDVSSFKELINYFVAVFNVSSNEWLSLFNGTDNEDIVIEENLEKEEKTSKYISSFDIGRDAFPFNNIGTYISPGGNCAGFALITAQLFNDNLYPETDSFEDNSKLFTYDISGNPEFDTLFDYGLYDFKKLGYWEEVYGNNGLLDRSNLSDSDAAFLDFLGYKWAESNANTPKIHLYNAEIKWSSFEKVIKFFENNNKILVLSMLDSHSGHAINAYGVEQDKDDPNVWYILVYDSNFANNERFGVVADNRVQVVKKTPLFGEPYLEFDYYPMPEKLPNYRYTSYFNKDFSNVINTGRTLFQMHYFELKDDELNIICD